MDEIENKRQRLKQFQQASQHNHNNARLIYLGVIGLIAFVIISGWTGLTGRWAQTLPHKEAILAGETVVATFAVAILSIAVIVSSYLYKRAYQSIAVTTRAMFNEWWQEGTDFRHDYEAHLETWGQYAMKEGSAVFNLVAMICLVTVIAAAIVLLNVNNMPSAIAPLELIDYLVMAATSLFVIVVECFNVIDTASQLIKAVLSKRNTPVSSYSGIPYGAFFTLTDRLALLQMPPKEVKTDETKDNA